MVFKQDKRLITKTMPTIFQVWRDKRSMFLLRHTEQKCQSWFTSFLFSGFSFCHSLSHTHKHTHKYSEPLYLMTAGALWGMTVFRVFISRWSRVWSIEYKAGGHCATRWPCALLLCRITLGTTSSPTSAGVICCWPNHTHKHYLSCCHISNTRGRHLFCACLSLLRAPDRSHRPGGPKQLPTRRRWLASRTPFRCHLLFGLPFQMHHVISLPCQQGVK